MQSGVHLVQENKLLGDFFTELSEVRTHSQIMSSASTLVCRCPSSFCIFVMLKNAGTYSYCCSLPGMLLCCGCDPFGFARVRVQRNLHRGRSAMSSDFVFKETPTGQKMLQCCCCDSLVPRGFVFKDTSNRQGML